ncbi:plasmid SOS inhibition protein A [Photorhabdus sp. RM71S]|uniref:plasmid SOS inhibition protein A n=1 Tax=Photorhabdus sp. RM71S TaxID=3342824 RepID=UPI0036DBA5D2
MPERQAAIKAVIHVEEKRAKDPYWKCHSSPYAQAFFRFLCGSSKITGRAINQVMGVYWRKEDKIALARYEQAFDVFIGSQGQCCPSPLPFDLACHIFPEVMFSRHDRQEKRWQREGHQYSRQETKRRQEREARYQNLVGRTATDLAFQTPETLRAWYLHWSQHDIRQYDMEKMLWSWIERCPSLSNLSLWMVPNKITLREVWS